MSNPPCCANCGAERLAEAPHGLCPRCLLDHALDTVPLDSLAGGTTLGNGPFVDVRAAGAGVSPTEPGPPRGGSVRTLLGDTAGSMPRIVLREVEASGPSSFDGPSPCETTEFADGLGRYHLDGEIARGGMGIVLKGRDADLGRDLAIKVLLEQHRDKPDLVRRFVEEAQIGGQLQHPGVVPVYELGMFPDARPYFSMKLVKGRTLETLLNLRRDPAADRARFLAIFEQVCQTMAYAHARGVIHRDLKPANVMVGTFGEVQVMDWGLAKVLAPGKPDLADAGPGRPEDAESIGNSTAQGGSGTDTSRAGSVLGTPAYMPPEQANGKHDHVDERADVFGLGSILCQILTGHPPYTDRSGREVFRKAERGDLAEAEARLDGCGADGELSTLARRCLAADPQGRPRDAGVVARAVMAYQAGVQQRLRAAERAQVEAEAMVEQERRVAIQERRSRRLTVALAGSLLLTAIVVAGGWRWIEHDRSVRRGLLADRINRGLQEATRLRGQAQRSAGGETGAWAAALAVADHARELADEAGESTLRRQAEALRGALLAEETQAVKAAHAADLDRRLLARITEIRSTGADDPDGSNRDAAYSAAFREAGLDFDVLTTSAAGGRLKARAAAVGVELIATIDDWAALRRSSGKNADGARRLTEAAQAADPDPWRGRLRAALVQGARAQRRETLRTLALTVPARELPGASLHLLGRALLSTGEPSLGVDMLRQAQRRSPKDVWVNHDLARALQQSGRTAEAIRYYTAARAIQPETAHELAHALEATGETDEAIVVLRDLTRLRPRSGWHLGCLGWALQARGLPREADAAFDAAIAALRESIRLDPADAAAHSNLGYALAARGRPDAAIAEYREAIRLKPGHASAHVNLGRVLAAKDQSDEAIAAYLEAIRLRPDDATAHHKLGSALAAKGQLDAAIASYRQAILRKPDSATAHSDLGSALLATKQPDAALAEYREAIRLKPDYATAHDHLGRALAAQGQLDAAIAEYREAIRLKPDYATAYVNLGRALAARGQPDAAIAAYREAIRLVPDSATAYNGLGAVLNDHKVDHEAAISALRESIRLDPSFATAHSNLGRAFMAHGQPDAAIAAYREAIRLKPDYAMAHTNLGRALAAKGQSGAAITAYREAIRLNPDDATAHLQLGLAQQRESRFSDALDSFRRARELSSPDSKLSRTIERALLETERMIALEGRLADVLRGDDQLGDAAERFDFARLCYFKGFYATSARLYEDAFASPAAARVDVVSNHRFNAACAAAMASSGQTRDEPPPDEADQALFRGKALTWLRSFLSARVLQREGGMPADRDRVLRELQHWQIDPDLAVLRDYAAMEGLPESERQDCQALWVDVDTLLRRARRGS